MKKTTLIVAGVSSFLLTSFTQLPASLILTRLPADLAAQPQGISGSIWQGAAETIDIQGVQIRNLQWDLQATALLKGQLAAQLRGSLAQGGQFEGNCGMTLAGAVHCTALNVTALPAQTLTPYLQGFMVPPLSGTLQLQLASMDWAKPALPRINGHVEWQEAGILMNPKRYGTYTAILSNGEDKIQQINLASAPNAAFSLNGNTTIQADGQYQTHLNLKPGNTINAATTQFLNSFVSPPQADGSYKIERQGKLNPASPT
jgi:general secretion pathway protein N